MLDTELLPCASGADTAPACTTQTPGPALGTVPLQNLLDRRLRRNPAFELLSPDQLPARLRSDLDGMTTGSDPHVVLVPRSRGGVTAKVLNGLAARLVESLGIAGHLSENAYSEEAVANPAIARLVLDGALEVHDGVGFVSGPRAHEVVFTPGARVVPIGPLEELSERAIRSGQELRLTDVGVLSRRLYTFGSIPRGPRWDRLAGSGDDLLGMLGLGPEGPTRRVLADDYDSTTHPGWLAFSRWAEGDPAPPALPYKLYVSPRPDAFADAFDTAVAVLANDRVWSFKVGRGVLGLLRPDKLVVYLQDFEQLDRVADGLAGALHNCPAQGVPFTASASPDGLLSWGMDPPPTEQLLASAPRESWRLWVSNRVASGLIHAEYAGGSVEPWQFALDRLALEGVDTARWVPADTIWSGPLQR